MDSTELRTCSQAFGHARRAECLRAAIAASAPGGPAEDDSCARPVPAAARYLAAAGTDLVR